MYADKITESMAKTIQETNRRREKQLAYNELHGITPTAIIKGERNSLNPYEPNAYIEPELKQGIAADPVVQYMSKPALEKAIAKTRKAMQEAAKKLEFLEAAQYRDELMKLEDLLKNKS
jgi:excinuclease ABC subunit B